MKTLLITAALLISASSFAQSFSCRPLPQETAPYFEFLNLSINQKSEVGGSYKAQNYGNKELEILGQANDSWMSIDGTPVARKSNRGQTVIDLKFNGRMGGDMDHYTLVVDLKTGEATLDMKYQTDCGDGRWHKEATQRFHCQVR